MFFFSRCFVWRLVLGVLLSTSPWCLDSVTIRVQGTNQRTLVYPCQNAPQRRHVPICVPWSTPARTTLGGMTWQLAQKIERFLQDLNHGRHIAAKTARQILTGFWHFRILSWKTPLTESVQPYPSTLTNQSILHGFVQQPTDGLKMAEHVKLVLVRGHGGQVRLRVKHKTSG